jgi:SOS regulatory protein LexA
MACRSFCVWKRIKYKTFTDTSCKESAPKKPLYPSNGSPVEEELADVMTLDRLLIKNPQATFLLRVTGDSMVDEGIKHGDLVLVERIAYIKHGDIVVANIDGEWTIKYFRRKGKHVYLEPANKSYRTIVPREELKIDLVVRAVIRQYRP